jgi:predicted ATPase/class 3 adenylate cyclase
MTFEEILDQAIAMLQRRGRMTYRTLKRQFQLDDEALDDLAVELIKGQRLAVDEDGEVLVWTGSTGTSPAPPVAPLPQPAAALASPDAERRQLTVLFCDLVDSTRLATHLDPEDLHQVVRAYQETCAEVIQRFEGSIAQYLGDGLLVYFGYPHAHEDDAPRAVRTGLGMITAMGALNTRVQQAWGVTLAVRVGIHTGLVVVGDVGSGDRHERLALGETPNVAARLQGLAAPDTVVISAATQRLVQGLFVCQAQGTPALKGLTQPLAVYRVLGASGAQSRFEVAVTTGLTPLVGREEELGLLWRRWEQARDGHGQVVLLSGEAGIGKSRLVQELRERVGRDGVTWMTFSGSPSAQQSALYPVLVHLQRLLHWHRDDAPEEKRAKLERMLATYRFPQQDTVPLLATLLSLPPLAHDPPLTLMPQQQRQRTLNALVAWVLEDAERQPVLMVWEDLHWADPSSLELLGLCMDQVPTARLLLVLTCRPEFHPPWPPWPQLTQLTLNRFFRQQSAEMVVRVAGGKALPAAVLQQIVAQTDGVPLFVEELTKTVLESDLLQGHEEHYELMGPLPPLAIPTTLHDALMARLDRLATVKVVAQLGATLGRTFPYELLQAVSPLDELELWRSLGQLVQAEVLYQRGELPHATYTFKHALLQEAAYQSLLRSTRRQYHQRIAQVLTERFPETVVTQPELLAYHYTEADLVEQAVEYWYKAGQRAHERSAHVEAVGHLRKGLELLQTLPDTLERRQQELDVQVTLGAALAITKGFAAPDAGAAYHRARELCQQVGETPQFFPVLQGLVIFYNNRGEYQTARELGEQLLSLAQRVHDPVDLANAHIMLGYTLDFLSERDAARMHLEQGVAFYNTQQHRSHSFLLSTHAWVFGLCRLAQVLLFLGYPDQALQRSREALALARELAHPFSLVTALNVAALAHMRRREGQSTYEQAEAALVLAREHGFAFRVAQVTALRGWALVEQGQGEDGIAQIRQALAALGATEARRIFELGLLAQACGSVGETEEGLRVVAEALAISDRSAGEGAGCYRLKGELLLTRSSEHHAEAESCFRQALEIARRQRAKSLELRTAMSLSRLWQHQGKRAEARELLAPIYDWFTEGFDTADLQEAKALLKALA